MAWDAWLYDPPENHRNRDEQPDDDYSAEDRLDRMEREREHERQQSFLE